MKIGIAITTHNRREIFNNTYHVWKLRYPDAEIVVVDDGSDIPCPVATTRFQHQQGIAIAKSECISLLLDRGCEYLFLSDDDCYPKMSGVLEKYINSGQKHMALSFQHNSAGDMYANDVFVKHKRDKYWVYNSPNGCLLYLTKEVAESVGGYDENFGIWSLEHKDMSMRIHRAGFTPYPFIDIPNGIEYFHSLDHLGIAESSVPEHIRTENSKRNAKLFYDKHKDLIGTITIQSV